MSPKYVVGSSVAIKWFVPEIYSEAASRLLAPDLQLIAPDLAALEFGALVYKKLGKNEISQREARDIIAAFQAVPLKLEPTLSLQGLALEVAGDSGLDFYDSIYLAMAIRDHCRAVTADRFLHQQIQDGPYREQILWVEDLP